MSSINAVLKIAEPDVLLINSVTEETPTQPTNDNQTPVDDAATVDLPEFRYFMDFVD